MTLDAAWLHMAWLGVSLCVCVCGARTRKQELDVWSESSFSCSLVHSACFFEAGGWISVFFKAKYKKKKSVFKCEDFLLFCDNWLSLGFGLLVKQEKPPKWKELRLCMDNFHSLKWTVSATVGLKVHFVRILVQNSTLTVYHMFPMCSMYWLLDGADEPVWRPDRW